MSNKYKRIPIKLRDAGDISSGSLFVGIHLAISSGQNEAEIKQLKQSRKFSKTVKKDLENFSKENSYTFENLSAHFSRPIGIITNSRSRRGKTEGEILRYPSSFHDAIWFDCSNPSETLERSSFSLMLNFKLSLARGCFGPTIKVSNFTEALLFFDIRSEFQLFNMKRIK